jgi:hypothetical protein
VTNMTRPKLLAMSRRASHNGLVQTWPNWNKIGRLKWIRPFLVNQASQRIYAKHRNYLPFVEKLRGWHHRCSFLGI